MSKKVQIQNRSEDILFSKRNCLQAYLLDGQHENAIFNQSVKGYVIPWVCTFYLVCCGGGGK